MFIPNPSKSDEDLAEPIQLMLKYSTSRIMS